MNPKTYLLQQTDTQMCRRGHNILFWSNREPDIDTYIHNN